MSGGVGSWRVVKVARKGGRRALKRLAAPITYRVPRKTGKWVVKASPGPHPADKSIPLAILLRDVLGIAKNLREVRYILRKGYVKIDGRPITDYKWPVGLMDVIELTPVNRFYRILPAKKYLIQPVEIGAEESSIKPLRIKVKTMVKGGKIQLTMHDGRNFLVEPDADLAKLRPGDSIIYDLVKKEVLETLPLSEGYLGLVTGGSKIGVVGEIKGIRKPDPLKPKLVKLATDLYGEFETIFDYVFVVGRDKPYINIP